MHKHNTYIYLPEARTLAPVHHHSHTTEKSRPHLLSFSLPPKSQILHSPPPSPQASLPPPPKSQNPNPKTPPNAERTHYPLPPKSEKKRKSSMISNAHRPIHSIPHPTRPIPIRPNRHEKKQCTFLTAYAAPPPTYTHIKGEPLSECAQVGEPLTSVEQLELGLPCRSILEVPRKQ